MTTTETTVQAEPRRKCSRCRRAWAMPGDPWCYRCDDGYWDRGDDRERPDEVDGDE